MMIRHVAQNAFRAVNLFQQQHAGQFVGKGHGGQGQAFPCAPPYRVVQTVGPPHNEAGAAAAAVVQLPQALRQLRRRERAAAFVQHNGHILRLQTFQQAFTFQRVPLLDGQRRVPAGMLCLDLRGETARGSGSLPEALHVEGRLWGSELMLEGVLRCLQQIRGEVRF